MRGYRLHGRFPGVMGASSRSGREVSSLKCGIPSRWFISQPCQVRHVHTPLKVQRTAASETGTSASGIPLLPTGRKLGRSQPDPHERRVPPTGAADLAPGRITE